MKEKMTLFIQSAKRYVKRVWVLISNPRFLLCFGISWLITNGWSYILFGFGTFFQIGWMVAVSFAYITLLWMPFTPEKIITVILSLVFLRWLFPSDEKTLGQLKSLRQRLKEKVREKRKKK